MKDDLENKVDDSINPRSFKHRALSIWNDEYFDDARTKNLERRRLTHQQSRIFSVANIDVLDLPEIDTPVMKRPFTMKKCYILIPASFFDMCSTCLMYVALTMTSAASFQMIRG